MMRPASAIQPSATAMSAFPAILVLSFTLSLAWDMKPTSAQDNFQRLTWNQRLRDPIFLHWYASPRSVGKCVQCHLEPRFQQQLARSEDSFGDFSRRSEMERWVSRDKHTIARRRVEPRSLEQLESDFSSYFDQVLDTQSRLKTLLVENDVNVDRSQLQSDAAEQVVAQLIGKSNVLSRRICDKLWGENAVDTEQGYAKFRDQCLTCHGGYRPGDQGYDLADVADAQLGIDCNRCHQIKDGSDLWVDLHDSKERWRLLTPEKKAEAGMRDLANTSAQSRLCLDCHVGNREQNMFVSHEMYAAGHPPLPSVEIQEFCQQMPQHWQTPGQLHESLASYQGRSKYFRINYPGLTDDVSPAEIAWQTRRMLIGALEARRHVLQLFIDSQRSDRWADYALYDCAACHHELQHNSVRQLRYAIDRGGKSSGVPGRPRPHEWPNIVFDTAIRLAGNRLDTRVRELESELADAFDEQPFGDASHVVAIAKPFMEVLGEAIDTAQRQPLRHTHAPAVIRSLAKTPRGQLVSYDAARQLTWAMRTVADEMSEHGMPLQRVAMAKLEKLWEPNGGGVELDLPSGRNQFIYRQGLARDLERRRQFDPIRFTKLLDEFQNELSARGIAGGE